MVFSFTGPDRNGTQQVFAQELQSGGSSVYLFMAANNVKAVCTYMRTAVLLQFIGGGHGVLARGDPVWLSTFALCCGKRGRETASGGPCGRGTELSTSI